MLLLLLLCCRSTHSWIVSHQPRNSIKSTHYHSVIHSNNIPSKASPSTVHTATNRRTLSPANVQSSHSRSSSALCMGLWEAFSSAFLQSREGDFVKLETTQDAYGPGPLLVCYNLPAGILDEEIYDMLADGGSPDCKLVRIDDATDPVLQMSMKDALERLMNKQLQQTSESTTSSGMQAISTSLEFPAIKGCLLMFSGFTNKDMMAVYNILSQEVYQETGGAVVPACAKAVPRAMDKPFRQVLEEIAGDHESALQMERDSGQSQQ
jgi:hypothetical protein